MTFLDKINETAAFLKDKGIQTPEFGLILGSGLGELAEEIDGAVVLGQFINKANPAAHTASTGPEIWEDTEGKVDIFVAGVGTGGTITGTGEYLKEKNPALKVIAVEPAASPVLSGGKPGPHGLQGIGAGFIPEILNTEIYDEIVQVENDEAYAASRMLAHKEGVLIGITSGAALHTAIELAKREENAGKNNCGNIAGYGRTIFVDTINLRYNFQEKKSL